MRPPVLFASLALALASAIGLRADQGVREVGPDDFLVSQQGGVGVPGTYAFEPGIAHDPVRDRYLVVWRGDSLPEPGSQDLEVFGQLIDGRTGEPVGDAIQISAMDPPGVETFFVHDAPVVAYGAGRFLVVWGASDDLLGDQLYGQLVDAASGQPVGPDDFLATDLAYTQELRGLAVAFDPVSESFLAAAGFGIRGFHAASYQIYGRRVSAEGIPLGAGAEQLTHSAQLCDVGPPAGHPALAYNAHREEYLLVWAAPTALCETLGDGTDQPEDREIFAQRLEATTLRPRLVPEPAISEMGPGGEWAYFVGYPAVAHHPDRDEYLVAWSGRDDPLPLGDGQIYVQRLDGEGGEIGDDDVVVSSMSSAIGGVPAASAFVAYRPSSGHYVVGWRGRDTDSGLGFHQWEVFVQAVDAATGAEVGLDDQRISRTGKETDYSFGPVLAAGNERYLAVWYGPDVQRGIEDETEVFGQLLADATVFQDGFESGDTAAWSLTVP